MTHLYRHLWGVLLLGIAVALGSAEAQAQRSNNPLDELREVGIDRKLGAAVPSDIPFRTADGEAVTLGQYLDGTTPILLNLVYHDCPMLCGLMLDGFTRTLRALDWTPGQQFRVLTVSFNPREGPAIARAQKEAYVRRLGRPEAADGWHFLTGRAAAIQRLTAAVGFTARWVPEKQEYAHPTAQIFLSGSGVVTRYINGIELPVDDVRKALVEASGGVVGTVIDRAVMYCFQFDPEKNTYTADAFNIMKIGSALTALLLGALLFALWRREHRALAEEERWKGPASLPS